MTMVQSRSRPLWITWCAPVATLLLAGSVVSTAWMIEGALASQRTLVNLFMPVGLAWLGSLFAACRFLSAGDQRRGAIATVVFLAIGVLFSPIANREWMRRTEAAVPAVSAIDPMAPELRAVVVLGGGASLGRDGRPQLNADGHRIVMAAQLWHAGKVSAIICTGEDNYIPGQAAADLVTQDQHDLWNPARLAVDLLRSLDVPPDRLHRIPGVNTAGEMRELSQFLHRPPATFPTSGPVGLITSAFHLPRAMRLAKREGMSLVPIPVAYRTAPAEPITVSDLVPNVDAGTQFLLITRERLAGWVGR